jgi:serine/threonine protein kinase
MTEPPAPSPDEPEEGWNLAEGDEIQPGRIALELLGGGFDFEAYLAWDDHLHALVVAKMVRPHLVQDSNTLRHLRREANMLARLAHPVVLRSFGVVLEGSRPHLILEHLEGPPLASTIGRFGSLDMGQLLPLGFQLASALQYMANEGVVHLDVKPRNVILGVPPRLIDLSIARTVEEAAKVATPLGTDAYMAPEQCDPGLAPIGPPADVWGLGATLYHAATGEVPFPRAKRFDPKDANARFPQLIYGPAEMPADLPRPLHDLLLATMEPQTADRPTAAAVALALEPLIGELKRGRILGRPRPRIL